VLLLRTLTLGTSSTQSPWLVLSDIDRTLIRGPQDIPDAGRVIRQLHNAGIPTVLASSKTFVEMVRFHEVAGLPPSPFIFENGCGIGWPHATRPSTTALPVVAEEGQFGAFLLGAVADTAINLLSDLREQWAYRFKFWEEIDPQSLFDLTGLDREAGSLAGQRLASVPLLWLDTAERRMTFEVDMRKAGLQVASGGTFLHVGPACDKFSAFCQLRDLGLTHATDRHVLTCGDNENDLTLLQNGAMRILFSNTEDSALYRELLGGNVHSDALGSRPLPPLWRVEGGGPALWLEAVEHALDLFVSTHDA